SEFCDCGGVVEFIEAPLSQLDEANLRARPRSLEFFERLRRLLGAPTESGSGVSEEKRDCRIENQHQEMRPEVGLEDGRRPNSLREPQVPATLSAHRQRR